MWEYKNMDHIDTLIQKQQQDSLSTTKKNAPRKIYKKKAIFPEDDAPLVMLM